LAKIVTVRFNFLNLLDRI